MVKEGAHQREAWQVNKPLRYDQGTNSRSAVANDSALVVGLFKLQSSANTAETSMQEQLLSTCSHASAQQEYQSRSC